MLLGVYYTLSNLEKVDDGDLTVTVVQQFPWARHKSRFTKNFEETAVWMSLHMSRKKVDPSIESVGRKSSSGQRDWQSAATKHNHGDEVFHIAKTISHSDRQLDFVVGRFNSCIGNTMPDG